MIASSKSVETEIYYGLGINSESRHINWTKQKVEKVIDGNLVYKSRQSIEPLIFPTAKVISPIRTGDTEIFVDNSELFNYEAEGTLDFTSIIVDNSVTPVAAALTANVSIAGTISSLSIVSGGIGYTGSTTSVSIGIPTTGIGTTANPTATATATITNGSITATTITAQGFEYNSTNPPKVLTPFPSFKDETISSIDVVQGFTGIVTGIGTTAGVGSATLALKIHLDSVAGNWTGNTLLAGYPIVISNTQVGTGVTTLYNSGIGTVGIGTTFMDNIYRVAQIHTNGTTGIITCNIQNDTKFVGFAATGSTAKPLGTFSWGRLATVARSGNPIAIGVSGLTIDA